MFGPEYHKIQTAFMRDDRGVIIPGSWTTPEFEYLADNSWTWTEKVDGTNVRVHWNRSQRRVVFGGRTDDAQIPTNLVANLGFLYDISTWESIFDEDTTEVTLYGEGYGKKVQGKSNYGLDAALILFDIKVGDWWLRRHDIHDIAGKFGLKVVPEMGTCTLREAVTLVETGLISSFWPDAKIEGLVGTPNVPLFDRGGDRVIAKIKIKDFDAYRRRSLDYSPPPPEAIERAAELAAIHGWHSK